MSRLLRLLSLSALGLWLLGRRSATQATRPKPEDADLNSLEGFRAPTAPGPEPLPPPALVAATRVRQPYLLLLAGVGGAVFVLGLQLLLGAEPNYRSDSDAREQAVTIASVEGGRGIDVRGIYRAASPSVLEVDASERLGDQADPEGDFHGTAFVVDDERHVVTNFHVVDGARQVFVVLPSGARLAAEVVGEDPSVDLAVLKVAGSDDLGRPLEFGDSSRLVVGDPVVAIGNPLGLVRSASSGIVSALDRQLTAPNNFSISQIIEFDAAIDHGSSGGPLLNGRGEVIGITTALAAEGSQFGFAVPSNAVLRSLETIRQGEQVEYAWLGVQVEEVTPGLAASLDLPAEHGALIVSVEPGGPAAKAGLRGGDEQVTRGQRSFVVGGDLIVGAGGHPVSETADLLEVLAAHRPGDELKLRYWRDGALVEATVELQKRPESVTPATPAVPEPQPEQP